MTVNDLIQKYKKLVFDAPQKLDKMDAWMIWAFVMVIEDLEKLSNEEHIYKCPKCWRGTKNITSLCDMCNSKD